MSTIVWDIVKVGRNGSHFERHGGSILNRAAIIHSRDGLQFKTISELYKECHVLAHASSRLGADVKVQNALDNKVARESEWSKKMSLCNASICEDYVEQSRDVNIQKTKTKIKGTLCEEQREHWRSKNCTISFSGWLSEVGRDWKGWPDLEVTYIQFTERCFEFYHTCCHKRTPNGRQPKSLGEEDEYPLQSMRKPRNSATHSQ